MNRAIIIGNLGAKPESKFLPSGQAVCEMRIATSEKFKDKSGAQQERTEWHRVVVFGAQAESCGKYLDKGRQVAVEGRIQTRTWDDKKTGEKKYMTEIVANHVEFLGGKGSRTTDEPGDNTGYGGGGGGGGIVEPSGDDQIPF